MYFKDTSGNKSLSATVAVIAFAVVMIKVLLSGVTVGAISFGEIDSLTVAAILTPTLGTYTARRWGTPAPNKQVPADQADNGLGGR